MKLYRFSELSPIIQTEIIEGKLLDIYRQGLTFELAKDIQQKNNIIIKLCSNELYDINGNYMEEIE
nr:MAG TPA: hypothetical protein [Caudoviricetes sp.]